MIEQELKQYLQTALESLYGIQQPAVVLESTREEVEGDFTLVVFPYVKLSKKSPEQTASELGEFVMRHAQRIASYNVIKGFLNFTIKDSWWVKYLSEHFKLVDYGFNKTATGQKILVEYSSPNTNKPLHLGHVRNIFLGYSVSQILKANGHEVRMCNLVNDRGIHICKSMLAWKKFGNEETPESSGMKGDHLVGKYYVIFDQHYKTQIKELIQNGMSEEEAGKQAPLILEAQEMLRNWEAGDAETVATWKMMNDWVYAGFAKTYATMGVSFDAYYYESNTYLLGKERVMEGLEKGVFFQKPDGSVWVDLTADGLDQKLLLRADGTSVYITQDVGTAELKYREFNYDKSIYVVGNEQDYHFKVLKLICQKLGKSYANGIYHLSYGMVELPHGKMKSREGTVVDADDLMQEMITTAADITKSLGKTEGLQEEELNNLYHMIGMGALKYFLLKVEPKKKMLFNPAESIDFQGNTGPFIQYTHARIKSILRNVQVTDEVITAGVNILPIEKKLIATLYRYPATLTQAGNELSPGHLANYIYELAKLFSQFYHECPIMKESNLAHQALRIQLCTLTAEVIRSGFGLLGIQVPERM